MSSIGQSILMALAVTVNKFASSNVQSVHRNQSAAAAASDIGRRGLLFSAVAAAVAPVDSRTELLKRYLKKSEQNKEKNDKEKIHLSLHLTIRCKKSRLFTEIG
ncbi:uncharacterized protein LOC111017388 isoform X2 [Momordica charantia]|uniref:Uncharacterized protein LOC111017388 isoform X2 n=1 Tax=Momordica charantia TaxID=3673 RepID=A0A6J1D554_MOMCH|nr:uncharacterized protein LOC111017388 isoform X2 [Momordica charantia]